MTVPELDAALVDAAAHRALVARGEFVAAMLDALAEGIVACDAEGTLVLFNRATQEFHGLPARALPPERWADHYDLFHADGTTPMGRDDVPLFRALSGDDVQDVEMVIAPTTGPPRTLLATGRQIRAEDGALLGAVVAMHDVTERRAVESELRREHEHALTAERDRRHAERLARLHDASLRLVREQDLPGLGRRLIAEAMALTPAVGGRVQTPRTDVTHGETDGVDVETIELGPDADDGELRLWSARPLDDGERELVHQLMAVASATARNLRLQHDLAAASAGRMRDELVASISHDMQTPAAAVVGLAETLGAHHETLSEDDIADITAAMARQGAQLSQLMAQFMDYCRLEAGRELGLRRQSVDLVALLHDVEALHAHTGRVRLLAPAPVSVPGDERRLHRLVTNLVANALKYTQGTEVRIDLRVEEGHAVIRVDDDGEGLGEDPERLFGRYARGSELTDGTGLGLYVGRAIAEAHGGSLVGRSRPDGGACFEVVLPLGESA